MSKHFSSYKRLVSAINLQKMETTRPNTIGFSPTVQTLDGQLIQEILQMNLLELSAYLDQEMQN